MANPTALVKSTLTFFDDTMRYWPIDPAVLPTTFYPGEMIGVNAAGLATHADDTTATTFLGLWDDPQALIDSTIPSPRARVVRPRTFTMPLISGTASRLTNMWAPVYIADSGRVQLSPTGLSFANQIGVMVDVHGADPTALTASEIEIMPWDAFGSGNASFSSVMSASWQQAQGAAPSAGSFTILLATRPVRVTFASVVFSTTSTSGTVTVTKDTGTQAPGAGTALLTAPMSLSGTANTVVNGTLIATLSTLTLAAGNRLALTFAGTLTGLAGANVSVGLLPI